MIAERSIRDLDTVIFPYAACWRHHVELQLKSLLAQLRALSDLPAEGRHHHRIDQLWQEARKPMIEHFPSEKADLAAVGNVINLSLIHISEPTRRTPISYAVFCLK